MKEIGVILNPNSRKNRHRDPDRAEKLQRIVGARGMVRETRQLDELPRTLGDMLGREKLGYLVADGGDGSLHWVMNESRQVLSGSGRDPDSLPPLVPTNGGTFDFVARKMGIKGSSEQILLRLTRELDAGRIPPLATLDTLELSGTRRDADGTLRPFERLGFALAAGGIGQRFFDKYYQEQELGAGAILRVVGRAVGSHLAGRAHLPLPAGMLRYGREVFRPTPARVVIDGRELECREHGAIHAGAFDITLAGVFRVFPLASEAGALHFQAGGIVPSEMIRALPDLYRGRAIKSRHLTEVRGQEMHIESLGGELLGPVIDGELFGGIVELTVRRGPAVRVPRLFSATPAHS